MKRTLFMVLLACSTMMGAHARGQGYKYTSFSPTQTVMANYGTQLPGCACGYPTSYNALLRSLQVNPSSINATIADKVAIRYDASAMCHGQSTTNLDAKAFWQLGVIQSMPDSFGDIGYKFSTPGNYPVAITVSANCNDLHCSQRCTYSGTVQVHIQ